MSTPLSQERGALSNVPDEDYDVPYNLSEAPGAHLKAIEQEATDIAKGQLDKVMESIGYQPHENDIDLSKLGKNQFPPTNYVIEPLLPKKHVTLSSGDGESLKSMTALQEGICVAIGETFAGLQTQQGRVLYYSMEDDEDMVGRRLDNMCEKLGVDPARLDGIFVARDMSITDPPYLASDEGKNKMVFTKPGQALLDEIAAGQFDLVIIDNASEAYAADETSRALVRQFMSRLSSAAKIGNVAINLISHVNKESAKGNGGNLNYSGSTQWHNSARSRLYFKRDGEHLTVTQEKLNVGRKMEKPLVAEFIDGALHFDAKGIEKRDKSTEDERVVKAQGAVLKALLWHYNYDRPVRAAESGSQTVHHCLQATDDYPKSLQNRAGRVIAKKAINKLFEAKLIEDYTAKKGTNPFPAIRLTDAGHSAAIELEAVPF